jgi:hypothetical protein
MDNDSALLSTPPPKLTRTALKEIMTPKNSVGSGKQCLTRIQMVHHGILARRRAPETTSAALPIGMTEDLAYYESIFEEFLKLLQGVPQFRVVAPVLEDLWGGYLMTTKQVYRHLSSEMGVVWEHVQEIKSELESWKAMALRYFQENQVLLSSVPEDDEKYLQVSESLEASRGETARLGQELEEIQANHLITVKQLDGAISQVELLSAKVREMEAEREALTPRPVVALDVDPVDALSGGNENQNAQQVQDTHDNDPAGTVSASSNQTTVEKVHALQQRYQSLVAENAKSQARLASCLELEEKRSLARLKIKEESNMELKSPIHKYLDMLEEKGEEVWKDQLIGMGVGGDVHKLFRFGGKIRNKHMSKRDTEKMVREVWKDRLASLGGKGSSILLVDFLGGWLQKKVGIAAAVLELGYNFLFGLWKYKWDADCELFLKILTGDVREEVYIAQNKLQVDLEELFEALDKLNGQASGNIPKEELVIALKAFFKVGKLDGKSENMFEDALEALEKDQPGPLVEWRRVFEEDREFNQGAFAECIREQFLTERKDLHDSIAVALYVECGDSGQCSSEQFAKALMSALPLMRDEEAAMHTAKVFQVEDEGTIAIGKALKLLSEGNLTTVIEDPVAKKQHHKVAGASAKSRVQAQKKQGQKQHSALINLALEEVRLYWVNQVASEATHT